MQIIFICMYALFRKDSFKLSGEIKRKIPSQKAWDCNMVRLAGLEPVTPTMSRWCSNQLSYSRVKDVADDKQF